MEDRLRLRETRSPLKCPGCNLVLMDRHGVRSSNVVAVGWEADEEGAALGTLEVEFKAGIVYQYTDVPEWVYNEFLYAPSPGKFLLQNIVEAFQGQRIE